jgi:1-acyl-sn-glycerol-3-phosphate acyltransferase
LLVSRYGRRPRIVAKQSLQWDPGLDVVLTRLSACFLPERSAPGDGDRVELMASLARGLRGSDAMLVFPEGGNWTPRRYLRALSRQALRAGAAQAADTAANRNVLPPRPAGVLACLAARPDLDVVVVAHTGLDDLISPVLVWRALPLAGRPMTVRWWPVPASAVPSEPEQQRRWLRVQWALVDSWIDARRARAGLPALAAGSAAGPLAEDDPDIGPVLDSPG